MPDGENMCVVKFHLGMTYGTFSHKFSVNESTVYVKYVVFKQKHKARLCLSQSTKMVLLEV